MSNLTRGLRASDPSKACGGQKNRYFRLDGNLRRVSRRFYQERVVGLGRRIGLAKTAPSDIRASLEPASQILLQPVGPERKAFLHCTVPRETVIWWCHSCQRRPSSGRGCRASTIAFAGRSSINAKQTMNFATLGSAKLGAAAVFIAAAILAVAGDALIRKGCAVVEWLGLALLGTYGLVVNLLHIDFSRLLGAYVGVFAVVSVLIGRVVSKETVPSSTWLGLAVILAGSAIIPFGRGG